MRNECAAVSLAKTINNFLLFLNFFCTTIGGAHGLIKRDQRVIKAKLSKIECLCTKKKFNGIREIRINPTKISSNLFTKLDEF